jgi:uncharacterized membrane protein
MTDNAPQPAENESNRLRSEAVGEGLGGEAGLGTDPASGGSPEAESYGFWSMTLVPFRRALVRGLAVVMPPLLTIVLFVWAWKTLDSYVLEPLEGTARYAIFVAIADMRHEPIVREQILNLPPDSSKLGEIDGRETYIAADGTRLIRIKKFWIPIEIYNWVETSPGSEEPITAAAYYDRYIQLRYLRREVVMPLFLIAFIILLYVAGKSLAVGMGRMLWNYGESMVNRLPLIRNVYSSVKQVTDFAFTENEIQCRRIVAIEYPRKGIWSLGFVTGEGIEDIKHVTQEPMVSVLVPTSPMPATGFTVTVPKSATVDLNISMDQAIQFFVSCGVVTPKVSLGAGVVEGRVDRKFMDGLKTE